eukprot:1137268-Prymnesium_polylepis.1
MRRVPPRAVRAPRRPTDGSGVSWNVCMASCNTQAKSACASWGFGRLHAHAASGEVSGRERSMRCGGARPGDAREGQGGADPDGRKEVC